MTEARTPAEDAVHPLQPEDPGEDLFAESDEELEEFLAAWEEADRGAAELLREALADERGADPPPHAEVAARLREDIRAGHHPAEWMHQGSGIGEGLPDDDAELLLRCLEAIVSAREDRGLEVEEETMLDTLEHADWLGVVVSLVRAGPGHPAGPRAIVAGIETCPEVELPGGLDLDERSYLEAAFSIVWLAWSAAGCVDRDNRLTALGAWALPRALARAWGTDFDGTQTRLSRRAHRRPAEIGLVRSSGPANRGPPRDLRHRVARMWRVLSYSRRISPQRAEPAGWEIFRDEQLARRFRQPSEPGSANLRARFSERLAGLFGEAGSRRLLVDSQDDERFERVQDSLLAEFGAWVERVDAGAALRRSGDLVAEAIHWMWGYGDGLLGRWTSEDLEEFFLGYAPRKLPSDEDLVCDAPDCAALHPLDAGLKLPRRPAGATLTFSGQ